MKRLLFTIIASTLITATLSSCDKDDSLPEFHTLTSSGQIQLPIILNLTTHHWDTGGNGVFSSAFANVIPANAGYSPKVYLVRNGVDTLINQPISFMNGLLWATNTSTDVNIHYRGDSQTVEFLNHVAFLNIKVVIG